MALNFLGLGFTFGAKDVGLQKTQERVTRGFSGINKSLTSINDNADKFELPRMVDEIPTEKITEFDDAVGNLGKKLGKDLPNEARKGATSFRRRGEDIVETQENITKGFGGLKEVIGKLDGILRTNRLQSLVQSLDASQKLKDFGNNIRNITESTGDLTNSLEDQAHQASITAHSALVNFGFTGKTLAKYSSQAAGMAISLKMDAKAAAESLRGMHEAGSELEAMGIKSATALAKLSDITGVSADVFRNTGLRMRKEFGLDDAAIRKVMATTVAYGKNSGDVAGAVGDLSSFMGTLSRQAALLKKGFKGVPVEKFAADTMGLAAAFFQVTQDSGLARQMALGMAEKFVEAGEDFSGLSIGAKDDLNELVKELSIVTGDVNSAFGMMKQGPASMMRGFTDLVLQAKGSGKDVTQLVNWIGGRLSSIFGADQAAQITNYLSNVTDASLKAQNDVAASTQSLGDLAKQSRLGARTLSESFEFVEQSFITRFRSISRKEAAAFVRETQVKFKALGDTLTEVAKGDGPLAVMVEKFSALHHLGAKALLPEFIRPFVGMIGEVAQKAAPMLQALDALGFKTERLTSPLGIATISLRSFYMLFAGVRDKALKNDQAFQSNSKSLVMLQKRLEGAKKAGKDYKSLEDQISAKEGIISERRSEANKKAAKLMVEDFSKIGKKIYEQVSKYLEIVPNIITEFTQAFTDATKNIDFSKIWGSLQALGDSFVKAFKFVFERIDFKKMWEFLGTALGSVAEISGKILGVLVDGFAKAFAGLGNALGRINISKIVDPVVNVVVRSFGAVGNAVKSIDPSNITMFVSNIFSSIFNNVGIILYSVVDLGKTIFDFVDRSIDSAFYQLSKMDFSVSFSNFFGEVFNFTQVIAGNKEEKVVNSLGGNLAEMVKKAFKVAVKFIGNAAKTFGGVIVAFAKSAKENLPRIGAAISETIRNIDWKKVVSSVKNIFSQVDYVVGVVFDFFSDALNKAIPDLSKINLLNAFQIVWDEVINFMRVALGSKDQMVQETVGGKLGSIVKKAFDFAAQYAIKGWWRVVFGQWEKEKVPFMDKVQASGIGLAATIGGAMMLSPAIRQGVIGSFQSVGAGIIGFFKKEKHDKISVVELQNDDLQSSMWEGAKRYFAAAKTKLKPVLDKIVSMYMVMHNKIAFFNENAFKKDMWVNAARNVSQSLGRMKDAAKQFFSPENVKGMKDRMKDLWSNLRAGGREGEGLGAKFKKGFAGIRSGLNAIAPELLMVAAMRAWEVGPKYAKAMWNTITDDTKTAYDKTNAIGEQAFGFFAEMLGISSETASKWWNIATDAVVNSLLTIQHSVMWAWEWIKAKTELLGASLIWAWEMMSHGFTSQWNTFVIKWKSGVAVIKLFFLDVVMKLRTTWDGFVFGMTEKLLMATSALPKFMQGPLANLKDQYAEFLKTMKAGTSEQKNIAAVTTKDMKKMYGDQVEDWRIGLELKKRLSIKELEDEKKRTYQSIVEPVKEATKEALADEEKWKVKEKALLAKSGKIEKEQQRAMAFRQNAIAQTWDKKTQDVQTLPTDVKPRTAEKKIAIPVVTKKPAIKVDRSATAAPPITPAAPKAVLEKGFGDVASATNSPSWWNEYKTLFEQKMDGMTQAVVTAVKGGRAEVQASPQNKRAGRKMMHTGITGPWLLGRYGGDASGEGV